MLKMIEKVGNKIPIHMITPTPNQSPNYETSNEIKTIDKCKVSVFAFDDKLGARISSQIDEFYTRGKHEKLDVYYISQGYYGLPKQIIRNNSYIILLSEQTLRAVESMYKNLGGYDMKHGEFKKMCRKAWSEKFNYLCFDMTKNKNEVKNSIFNESKNTYILTVFVKKKLFSF